MISSINRFWNYSIKRQLILGFSFLTLLSLMTMSINILIKQSQFIHEESISQAKNRTALLANNSVIWVLANDFIGLEEVLDSLNIYTDMVYAMVVDLNGKVLVHTDHSKVGKYLVDELSVKHLKSKIKESVILNHDDFRTDHSIEVVSPIIFNDKLLAYARTKIDHKYWALSLEEIKFEIFTYTTIAMILTILFAYFSANRLTKHLYNLIEVTKRVKDGEKNIRAIEVGVGEISILAHEFNDMLHSQEANEKSLKESQHQLELDIKKRKKAERTITDLNKNLEQTVHTRTRELIVEKERAEKANKAKSIFLANMSHELRTPLNAILGFSQIMSNDTKITQSQKENLNIINYSGEHLLSLINDILDMSKIEAGRVELEFSKFDLLQMLQDISLMIKQKAKDKDLRFSLEIHSDLLRYIDSDSSKIKQILINILNNSIKYTDEGGVSLKLKSEPLVNTKQFKVTFEIEDSGKGMSQEELKTIFEPFTQVQSSKGVTEGTGLGLSITHKFLELLNADVNVNSEMGKGTTFTFSIVVNSADVDDIESAPKPNRVLGILKSEKIYKILIVEDQKENLMLLRNLLMTTGFDVYEARNGKEAIEKFKEHNIDFIWMDMRMPIMSGYDATKAIRSLGNGKDVIIVALTASAFQNQNKDIIDVGCNELLHKPYKQEDIFNIMKKYLNIEYIYQEDFDDTTESAINSLDINKIKTIPDVIRKSLYEALIELDSIKISREIEKIKEIDEYMSQNILKLAQNYEYDKIIDVLDEVIEEDESK